MAEDQIVDVAEGIVEPANDELSWSWKREPFQSCRAKINTYTRYKVVDHIKKELHLCGQAVYDEFRGSCFGHFLDFDSEAVTCNAALHAVLARQIVEPNAPADELWFRIGEQSVRFSKVEYCLVTGLKFGDSTFDPNARHVPPMGGFYDRRFHDQSVVLWDLWDKFKDGWFRDAPTDALKVAKVLVVMAFLFGVDNRTTVDPWLWALVEDSPRWESFPWGKYTFQMLLYYIGNVPMRLSESGKPPAYHIYGFPIALLIWAFEAIPSLGSFCATRQYIDVTPRCLWWKMPKKMISMTDFFTSQVESCRTLSASREEQGRHYWQDIEQSTFEGIQFVHPKNPFVLKTGTSTAATSTKGTRFRRSISTTMRGASKRQKTSTSANGSQGILRRPAPRVQHRPLQSLQPPLLAVPMDRRLPAPMDPPHEVQVDPSTRYDASNDVLGVDPIEDIRGTEFESMDDDNESVPTCETEAQYQQRALSDIIQRELRYIEFYDVISVPMAIALSGQPLLGQPMMVKPSEAEKNLVQSTASVAAGQTGRYAGGARRLYVGNLHLNITEDQLRQVFEPFGSMELFQLPLDESGNCKGVGFVQFARLEDAKNELNLNGQLVTGGRVIKVIMGVSTVTDQVALHDFGTNAADLDDDKGGGLAKLGCSGIASRVAFVNLVIVVFISCLADTASGSVGVPVNSNALTGAAPVSCHGLFISLNSRVNIRFYLLKFRRYTGCDTCTTEPKWKMVCCKMIPATFMGISSSAGAANDKPTSQSYRTATDSRRMFNLKDCL
ncbi:hypothetical protein DITRI_Ditri01bG0033700 [Diplodiscus trichospermus]